MSKKGCLSTPMEHARPATGKHAPRNVNTSGDNPPFNEPHTTGKDTIPVVFRGPNLDEKPAKQVRPLSTPMKGPTGSV
jgi:hypothetical protein